MIVLIGQKRIEWDGRYNSNQPSFAKFVYGTTAWKLVLAGCISVVAFRIMDPDQITKQMGWFDEGLHRGNGFRQLVGNE